MAAESESVIVEWSSSDILNFSDHELFHRFCLAEKVASETSHYSTVQYSCHLFPNAFCSYQSKGKDAAKLMKRHMGKHKSNLKRTTGTAGKYICSFTGNLFNRTLEWLPVLLFGCSPFV